MIRLSILIPAYNSEQTIGALVQRIIKLYGQRYALQIITVNDGSADGTEGICRALQAEFPEIVTHVTLARNFGEHNAVMAGLHHVTGRYCVIMDDDFQNPPEEVEKLVEEIQKGYDVVYTAFIVKRHGFIRNFGSALNDVMAKMLLKKPGNLYLSSFKVVKRFIVDEIIRYTGPDPYIDGIIMRSTSNIGTVIVEHDVRRRGRSGYTIRKLISLWGNMVVNFSLFPIRLIGVVGFLMIVAGVLINVFNMANLLVDLAQHSSNGFSNDLVGFILIMLGINCLALSIIGEYVGRVYMHINKGPQFVVREVRHNLAAVEPAAGRRFKHAG